MPSIVLAGEGGQGIRVISHILATLLSNLGYEVSLLYDYDSTVRGAMSRAYLRYDKEPIGNPIVDKADVLLKLSHKGGALRAEKSLGETGMQADEEIPFGQLAMEVFGKEILANMIALGSLLRLIGLEVSDEELKKAMPFTQQTEALDAVCFGNQLTEADLGRGVLSTRQHNYFFTPTRPRAQAPKPLS